MLAFRQPLGDPLQVQDIEGAGRNDDSGKNADQVHDAKQDMGRKDAKQLLKAHFGVRTLLQSSVLRYLQFGKQLLAVYDMLSHLSLSLAVA